jgi:hypothetical protein
MNETQQFPSDFEQYAGCDTVKCENVVTGLRARRCHAPTNRATVGAINQETS